MLKKTNCLLTEDLQEILKLYAPTMDILVEHQVELTEFCRFRIVVLDRMKYHPFIPSCDRGDLELQRVAGPLNGPLHLI